MRKNQDVVVSLKRGLDLLRAYGAQDIALNNSELVALTGLPKSTIARFTYTLTSLGYLQDNDRQGSYRLGDEVVPLGNSLLASLPVCQVAQPLMQAFADAHDVAVFLAGAHLNAMAYLVHCSGNAQATRKYRTGSLVGMSSTAVGQAYLWALRPARRSEHFALIAAEYGDEADTVLQEITASFKEIDKNGYCCIASQWRGEAYSLAVPLILAEDDAVLALGCSVPHQKLDNYPDKKALGDDLLRLAAAISNTMADRGLSFWDD